MLSGESLCVWAGYIVSHAVKHLFARGYECVVADNLIYGHRQSVASRADFFHADLMDKQSLYDLLNAYNIEAVIHFAASESITGKRCPVEYTGRRAGDPARLFSNSAKAKKILGRRSDYIGIDDIIETAWRWKLNRKY